MRESKYQGYLIKEIKKRLPGSIVLKNDSGYLQGIPDLMILFGKRWGTLETKISAEAPVQPNQEYYVDLMNQMSFSSFIYPEIEEEVLYELELALRA